jgi:hypothetical protein
MRFTIWAASAVLLAAASAYAQQPAAVRINVPFGFSVEHTTLPAGEYTISNAAVGAGRLLAMENVDTRRTILFTGNPVELAKTAQQSSLVFTQHENGYVLAEVLWAGYSSGVELPAAGPVNEVAITASNRAPDAVVIASR